MCAPVHARSNGDGISNTCAHRPRRIARRALIRREVRRSVFPRSASRDLESRGGISNPRTVRSRDASRCDFTCLHVYVTFRSRRCPFLKGRPDRKGGRLSGATRWSVDEMIYGIVCIKLHARNRASTTGDYVISERCARKKKRLREALLILPARIRAINPHAVFVRGGEINETRHRSRYRDVIARLESATTRTLAVSN